MPRKRKAIVGIDPGKHGAAALLVFESPKRVEVADFDGDPFVILDIFREWMRKFRVEYAFVEYADAFRTDNPASAFTFGRYFGMFEMLLMSLQIPFEFVRPFEWQSEFFSRHENGLRKPSLTVARRLFPKVSINQDANRADALLIALHGLRKYQRQEVVV